MGIYKNGILTTNNFYESSSMNYVSESELNETYSYTPTTATNSCMNGFTVDLSNCTAGEKVYIKIHVSWSGFDTSNTSGTFNMYFQGSNYNVANAAWDWNTSKWISDALNSKNKPSTFVLTSDTGAIVIETSTTIPSEYPKTYSKTHVGIRADYSNGTGKISIWGLEVIPEKYYVSSDVTSTHIAEDYISSKHFQEL